MTADELERLACICNLHAVWIHARHHEVSIPESGWANHCGRRLRSQELKGDESVA